jgi:hypothetical protein
VAECEWPRSAAIVINELRSLKNRAKSVRNSRFDNGDPKPAANIPDAVAEQR